MFIKHEPEKPLKELTGCDLHFKPARNSESRPWQAMFDLAVLVTTTIYSVQEKHLRVFFSPHF
jgi:hypothetical protein